MVWGVLDCGSSSIRTARSRFFVVIYCVHCGRVCCFEVLNKEDWTGSPPDPDHNSFDCSFYGTERCTVTWNLHGAVRFRQVLQPELLQHRGMCNNVSRSALTSWFGSFTSCCERCSPGGAFGPISHPQSGTFKIFLPADLSKRRWKLLRRR